MPLGFGPFLTTLGGSGFFSSSFFSSSSDLSLSSGVFGLGSSRMSKLCNSLAVIGLLASSFLFCFLACYFSFSVFSASVGSGSAGAVGSSFLASSFAGAGYSGSLGTYSDSFGTYSASDFTALCDNAADSLFSPSGAFWALRSKILPCGGSIVLMRVTFLGFSATVSKSSNSPSSSSTPFPDWRLTFSWVCADLNFS